MIGFTLISPLRLLFRLCPRRLPTASQLCTALTGVYVLAITMQMATPDLFDALQTYGSAQSTCFKSTTRCYAAGRATWTDNIALKRRLTLILCNRALYACSSASAVGFIARVAGCFNWMF